MSNKLNIQLTDKSKFSIDPINIDGTIQYKFSTEIDLKAGLKGSVSFIMSKDHYNKFVSGAVNVSATKNLALIDLTVAAGGKCIAQVSNVVCSVSAKGYAEPVIDGGFEFLKNDARLNLVEVDIEAVIPNEAFTDPSMANLGDISINTNAEILGVDSSDLNTIWYTPQAQEIQQQQWNAMSSSQKALAIKNNVGPNSDSWNDNVQNLAKELALANKDYETLARDMVWEDWTTLSSEDQARAVKNNMSPHNTDHWNTLVEQKSIELKQIALEKFNSKYSLNYVEQADGTKNTLSLENGNLTKTSYDENNNQLSSVSLAEGQTISHIAQKLDGINSIDLLEYNNLTLEQAKNLPVGFEVKIPKDITEVQGKDGAIKIYEGYDETGVILQPDGNRVAYDENSDLVRYGDNDKITFTDKATGNYQEWQKDSSGDIYKSLESNNDFTIKYDNTKKVTDIDIHGSDVKLEDIAKLTEYSKEDLRAYNFLDAENLLLNTLFCPCRSEATKSRNEVRKISALPQKKYLSLSLLSSNILFPQSLELEKNRVFNNRFNERIERLLA